jgi:CBS domain-containing protein
MSVHVAVILNRKGIDVATISPDATVADAVRALTEHRIGALVVSDDGRTVVGMLSERDVVRWLASDGAAALGRSVAEIMTTEVITCGRQTSADELMSTMTQRRIRHIPVLEEGELAGLVSIGDVVKSRMDDLETQTESLEAYITGTSY